MTEGLHVSADDLAVRAAKEKLAALAGRPGYREAMSPRPTGSRRAVWILLATGAAFYGLSLGSCTYVSATWLRWIFSGVFVALGLFAWLLAIGASPTAAPATWPAAVLGKATGTAPAPAYQLTLLRDDGETVTVATNDALHAILRAGDVGVAHVRALEAPTAAVPTLIAFHRL